MSNRDPSVALSSGISPGYVPPPGSHGERQVIKKFIAHIQASGLCICMNGSDSTTKENAEARNLETANRFHGRKE